MFKFEGGQEVYIGLNPNPVKVIARTEFFDGRQPRYCVESETSIPGKNMNQDWINEDKLSDVAPKEQEVEPESKPEEKAASILQGKNMRGMKVREIKKG